MKRNEIKNLKTKDVKELEKSILEKNLELAETKAGMTVTKAKNLKKVKMLRRDISQIATVLTEKRLAEEVARIKDTEKKGEGEDKA